jgi:hypothetical protein
MQDRFAFTAKPWGNAAVVCRATEDYPGPIVDQEFGIFETWTRAHSIATRLNEGLKLDPLEARQILTSSFLYTSDLLRAGDSQDSESSQHVRLLLAETDLALTSAGLRTLNQTARRTACSGMPGRIMGTLRSKV